VRSPTRNRARVTTIFRSCRVRPNAAARPWPGGRDGRRPLHGRRDPSGRGHRRRAGRGAELAGRARGRRRAARVHGRDPGPTGVCLGERATALFATIPVHRK